MRWLPVLLFLVTPLLAQDTKAWREHFEAKGDGDASTVWIGTEIHHLTDRFDESFVLLRDQETGDDYKFTHAVDVSTRENVFEVRDLRHKSFLRVSYPFGKEGSTLSEVLKSALAQGYGPKRETQLRFDTEQTTLYVTQLELEDPLKSERLTRHLRTHLDPNLLDALDRMEVLFPEPPLFEWNAILGIRIFRGGCPRGNRTKTPVQADCDFDASFGLEFKCSDEQRAQVDKATAAKELLVVYGVEQ